MRPRVLVAGMGNDLCRDDGFGIETARRFAETEMPTGVRVYEAGIGGIGLIQELMDGYEALIILDAVDRGGEPGTVYLLQTQVPQTEELSTESKQGFVADMHYTVPSKALTLAQALDVLPPQVYTGMPAKGLWVGNGPERAGGGRSCRGCTVPAQSHRPTDEWGGPCLPLSRLPVPNTRADVQSQTKTSLLKGS